MSPRQQSSSLFSRELMWPALVASVRKLDPRVQLRNPVMFVVEVGAALVSGRFAFDAAAGRGDLIFEVQIVAWLWLTVP